MHWYSWGTTNCKKRTLSVFIKIWETHQAFLKLFLSRKTPLCELDNIIWSFLLFIWEADKSEYNPAFITSFSHLIDIFGKEKKYLYILVTDKKLNTKTYTVDRIAFFVINEGTQLQVNYYLCQKKINWEFSKKIRL